MRYRNLSPKYIYGLGILVIVAGLVFLTFLNNKAIISGEWIALIILLTLTSCLLFWLGFYINRFVYAKIDLKNRTVIYGNFLFEQEIDINAVKLIGRSLLFRKMFIVQMGKKKYYINSIVEDFPSYFI